MIKEDHNYIKKAFDTIATNSEKTVTICYRYKTRNDQEERPAMYDFNLNEVIVYPENLINVAAQYGILPDEYAHLVACHEFGHVNDDDYSILKYCERLHYLFYKLQNRFFDKLDRYNKKDHQILRMLVNVVEKYHEIELLIEKKACEIGRNYIPNGMEAIYEDYSAKLIESYHDKFENMLADVNTLRYM